MIFRDKAIPMNGALISSHKLSRIYSLGSTQVVGISDVDLSIAEGEMVVLKGNSGSGKSTLLALLAGLDRPSFGQLSVAGRELQELTPSQLNEYRRDVVGMVFQHFNLLPTLTVYENIALPALLSGRPAVQVEKRASDLMEWLNLSSRAHHGPSQLSGGEMQRTAIARALINEPALILADEPTGNLDSLNGHLVIKLLADLNRLRKRTVVVATHSTLADPYATLEICLKDGRITGTSA